MSPGKGKKGSRRGKKGKASKNGGGKADKTVNGRKKDPLEEVRADMEAWLGAGMVVDDLADLVEKGDVEGARALHKAYATSIKAIERMRSALEGVLKKGDEAKIRALLEDMNDPKRLSYYEERYAEIMAEIEEKDRVRDRIQADIESWKKEGFDVTPLENVMEGGDAEEIARAYGEYKDRIERLRGIKDKLSEMDFSGFEMEVEAIYYDLHNPDKVWDVEKRFLALIQDLEVKSRIDSIKAQAKEWSDKGYNIRPLEDALDNKGPEAIIKEYETCKEYINGLMDIKSRLDELERSGWPLEGEISTLKKKLNRPYLYPEIEKKYHSLEEMISEWKAWRERAMAAIERWENEAFVLKALRDMVEDRSRIKEAIETFDIWAGNVTMMRGFRDKLRTMDFRGFEDYALQIKKLTDDPRNVDKVREMMRALEDMINATKRKRTILEERMKLWMEQGYIVDDVERVRAMGTEELEVFLMEFERNIMEIKTLSDGLEGLRHPAFTQEFKSLKDLMRHPMRIDDIKKAIADLEEKVANYDRIKALRERVEALGAQGYVTKRLDDIWDKDLAKIEAEVQRFEEDIKALAELEDKVREFEDMGLVSECIPIREKLRDPDKIEDIRKDIEHLRTLARSLESLKIDYITRVREWYEKGYKVEPLLEMIDAQAPFHAFKIEVDRYEAMINDLEAIKKEISSLDTTGFDSLRLKIFADLKDPEKAPDIRKMAEELKRGIKERNTLLEGYRKEAKEWKDMGFDVSELMPYLKGLKMEETNRVYQRYRKAIEEMLALEKRWSELAIELGSIDPAMTKDIERRIASRFRDISAAPIVRAEIARGEERIGEFKALKKAAKETIMTYRQRNFDTTAVEEAIRRIESIDDLNKEISRWKSIMEEITEMRDEVSAMKDEELQQDIDRFMSLSLRPERYEEIKASYADIKAKFSSREELREHLLAKVARWDEEGWDVSDLKAMSQGGIGVFKTAVEDFEAYIKWANSIISDLKPLSQISEFVSDVEAITSLIRSRKNQERVKDMLKAIFEGYNNFKATLSEMKMRIDRYRRMGYFTEQVEKALERGAEEFIREFKDFEARVSRLSEIEAEIKLMNTHGLEEDVRAVMSKIMDPYSLEEVEREFKALREKAGRINERRKAVVEELRSWAEEGYIVDRIVKHVETLPINVVENEMVELRTNIEGLEAIKRQLSRLDTQGFEPIVEDIKEMARNPDNYLTVKTKFLNLKIAVNLSRKIRALNTKMEAWEREGFDVGPLRSFMLDGHDIGEVEKMFAEFEMSIEKAKGLKTKIEQLRVSVGKSKDLMDKLQDLDERLTNPMNYAECENELSALVKEITARKERFNHYRSVVATYQNKGYDTRELEDYMERCGIGMDMARFKDMLNSFEQRVAGYEKLMARLESIPEVVREKNRDMVNTITDMIHRFGEESEILQLIAKLEAQSKEAPIRAKIDAIINAWASDGYVVDRLREMKDAPLPEVKAEIDRYNKIIKKSKELQKKLMALDLTSLGQAANTVRERIMEKLRDVDRVFEAETDILALEVKAEEEISKNQYREEFAAIGAQGYNIDKILEIIDTYDPEIVEEKLRMYRENYAKAERLKEKVSKLLVEVNNEDIQSQLRSILEMLPDLERTDEAVAALERAEGALKEHRVRAELVKKIEEWENSGYHLGGLKVAVKTKDINTAMELYKRLEKDIKKLEGLAAKLNKLQPDKYPQESIKKKAADIKRKIKNPEKIFELETEMLELEIMIERIKSKGPRGG